MSPDVMPEAQVALAATEPGNKTDRASSRARAARRRKIVVTAAHVVLLVAVLGLWAVLSRAKAIDPFNFSMPSRVWDQVYTWMTHGTAIGSLGTFNTAGVYAAMVILAVVALAAEGLLTFAERRIFRWKPTGSDS